AIERHRELERDPWAIRGEGVQERRVQLAGRRSLQAHVNRYTSGSQSFDAARRRRVRIASRHHYAGDSRSQQRIHAWRRLPMMRAGFEGDEDRGATRALAGRPQRHDFGVRRSVAGVISLADNRRLAHDDRAHHRIGRGLSPATPRERQRSAHEDRLARPLARGHYLRTTWPLPGRTRPSRQAPIPPAVAAAATAAATAGSHTTTIPTPMLNARYISARATPPARSSSRNTLGMLQLPVSTSASRWSG